MGAGLHGICSLGPTSLVATRKVVIELAVPDNPLVAKVAMVFTRDTRTFINTFHCTKNPVATWTQPELVQLAIVFREWWDDFYKLYASDAVSLGQVQVRVLDPDNPLGYDLPVSPPIPGTNQLQEAPGSATQTISWRTGLAGRKYRGRDYAVGLSDVAIADDDRVTSPYTSVLAQAAVELLTALATATFRLVVFHRADNTFTQVVSFIVESILDSQRRRLPARGR